MADPAIELSLVIPAFNQRIRTMRAAREASGWLRERFGGRAELIVVDDGSRPGDAVTAADAFDSGWSRSPITTSAPSRRVASVAAMGVSEKGRSESVNTT